MLGILISIVGSFLILMFTVVKTVFELVTHLLVLINPFGIIFNLLSFTISSMGWALVNIINILFQIVSFVVARIVPGLLELITHILEALCLGLVYLTQFINSTMLSLSQFISKYTLKQHKVQPISQLTYQPTQPPTYQPLHQPIYQPLYQPINQNKEIQMLFRRIQIQNNNISEPISINFNPNENTQSIPTVSFIQEFIQEYGNMFLFVIFVFVVMVLYRRGRIIQKRNRYQFRRKQIINQASVIYRYFLKIKQKVFKFIEKCTVKKEIKKQNTTAIQTIMNSLSCPITCCPLKEPACLKCGHTFEKQPLIKCLKLDPSCPLCRKPCNVLEIYDNYVLKEILNILK